MKKLSILSLAIVCFAAISAAHAEDAQNTPWYDSPFHNETPAGLAEHTVEDEPAVAMDDVAQDLQDIMPAAGEEDLEDASEPQVEAAEEPAGEE